MRPSHHIVRGALFVVCLAAVLVGWAAPVPEWVLFQGRVLVQGVPFEGTGQFKFALVNADGTQTYWRNSLDVLPADGVPDEAVSVAVIKGVYSVPLGDTTLPNMTQALGAEVLSGVGLRLRVWFNDGAHGFEQLEPDQPLGSVPYALVAARVAENPVFSGQVGIGVEVPTATLDVAGRINGTSLSLNGVGALEMPGSANVFVGGAGNGAVTGFNTTGVGLGALASVGVGYNNTAVGAYALFRTAGGGLNTGLGVGALFENTEGTANTALGHDALHDTTTGSRNIGIGMDGGRNLTTGSDNIAIGHEGVAGESGTIRIGTAGTHHTTHLAGVVKADRFEGDGGGLTGVPGTMGSTGTVVAWGSGEDGQTTVPAGLIGVKAVAAGGNHTVALKEDGTVVAWGAGQTAVPAGLSGVKAVAAGGNHTVALKEDGTVVAWGSGGAGQTTVPAGLIGVKAVAAGSSHTLALKEDGTVVAWGWNQYGQTTVPAGLGGVKAVAAGETFTVALKEDGTVVTWGTWGYVEDAQVQVPAGLNGVKAVAASVHHIVALKEDGTVVAWGENWDGQTTVPAGLSGVKAVAAGGSHTVALKEDGTVVAWGSSSFGLTTVPAGLGGVTAVAAGWLHTVALRTSHGVVGDLVVSGQVAAQAFVTSSDREAKRDIVPVDPQAVLAKVAELPLAEWSFRTAPGTRHLGPMAQDFRAAFGLGSDDRHIATVDADGVALAAIQALHARVVELERDLARKTRQIEQLLGRRAGTGAERDAVDPAIGEAGSR